MDFSTFKKKLEEADVLLAALRTTSSKDTREALALEIADVIDRMESAAEALAGNGQPMRQILSSLLSEESHELRFENVLGAYYLMRRTR